MTPRHARLGVDIFTLAVAASVGIALAGLTWRISGDPGIAPAAAPPPAALAGPVDLAPLIALAPFGAMATVSAEEPRALQLRGIFLASPIESSTVLIASNNGPAQAYRIGQAIGGGTIAEIAVDRVSVRTPAGMQSLMFPDRGGGTPAVAATTTTATAPAVAASPGAAPSGVEAIRALIPDAARGTPTAPTATGAAPPSASPGYRVGAGAPPALQAAGVRPGDVIERVNGTPLGDPARDQHLIAAAMTSGAARIEIMRDGRAITLSVPLR